MTTTLVARPPRRPVFLAYLRLPHAVPIISVLSITVGLTIAIGGWPVDWHRLALMLLAMLGGQVVVGVVNELVDVDHDRVARPDKPLVSGLVSQRGARWMLWIGLAMLTLFGGALGALPLAICLLGNGVGVAYSIWFKRTRLAWLPYLIALPLLPIWVAVCVDAFSPRLLLLYPLGAFAVGSLYLAQSAPDIASDRAAGLRTVPTRLGERRTLLVVWIAFIVTALVMGLLGAIAGSGVAGSIPSAVAIALVIADLVVYALNPRRGVLLAFPMGVAVTAIVALTWLVSGAS